MFLGSRMFLLHSNDNKQESTTISWTSLDKLINSLKLYRFALMGVQRITSLFHTLLRMKGIFLYF